MSTAWRVKWITLGDCGAPEETFLDEEKARACVRSIQQQGRPVSLYCNEFLGEVADVREVACGLRSDQGWYKVSI